MGNRSGKSSCCPSNHALLESGAIPSESSNNLFQLLGAFAHGISFVLSRPDGPGGRWTCVPHAVHGSHTGGSRWTRSTRWGSRSRHRALRPSHAAQRRGTVASPLSEADRWSTCWGSRSRHTSPPPASSPARSTAAARTLESEPASPQGWQVPLASTIGLGW